MIKKCSLLCESCDVLETVSDFVFVSLNACGGGEMSGDLFRLILSTRCTGSHMLSILDWIFNLKDGLERV